MAVTKEQPQLLLELCSQITCRRLFSEQRRTCSCLTDGIVDGAALSLSLRYVLKGARSAVRAALPQARRSSKRSKPAPSRSACAGVSAQFGAPGARHSYSAQWRTPRTHNSLASDYYGDGSSAREQMRQDMLDTPLHLRADLLAHFTKTYPKAPP